MGAPDPAALAATLATPLGFARGILGLDIYDWGAEVLGWYEQPRRRTLGALVTPNGAGKSSRVVAALALWWVAVHRRGKVVITTKDAKQLDNQLYPALLAHRPRFSGWTWVTSPCIQVITPTGGSLVAFTTNDAARAEGWHKEDDVTGPLLIIVDEAKSVEEPIFQSLDRCMFNGLLYVSSPGLMMGRFYDAFTKHRHLFRCRKVSLLDCPHIEPERIAAMREMYKLNPQYLASVLDGEFMDQESGSTFIFPLSIVQRAIQDPPRKRIGDRGAFLDFAAGGDENVIALREGNEVTLEACWRDADTMQAAGRFLLELKRLRLEPGEVWGDADGMGKPIIQRLGELGYEINEFHGGSPPFDRAYTHRVAEAWHGTARAVGASEVRLPDDSTLIEQLVTRKATLNSAGRIGVEKKEDMKKRGVNSPDRADAVCGAWHCRQQIVQPKEDPFERWAEMVEEEHNGGALLGAWTG